MNRQLLWRVFNALRWPARILFLVGVVVASSAIPHVAVHRETRLAVGIALMLITLIVGNVLPWILNRRHCQR